MSPEVPASQKNEPTLNTPESVQECFDLAKMISTQVEIWGSRARSPIMHNKSMAHFIAEDCEPLNREPIDYTQTAQFGGSRSREEARFLTDFEKRRSVLSKWAHTDTFDNTLAINRPLAEYYEAVASFSTNPYVPEDFKTAMQSLWRLYLLSEHLAIKTGEDLHHDASGFTSLIVRLAEELY